MCNLICLRHVISQIDFIVHVVSVIAWGGLGTTEPHILNAIKTQMVFLNQLIESLM